MSKKLMDQKEIDLLNKKYRKLDYKQRIEEVYKDFDAEKILLTSSFGATSIVMIHLFTQMNPKQKVHFIDTTYHFDETLAYKEKVRKSFNLNIETVKAEEKENTFTRENRVWEYNQNLCCFINKVDPLDKIKPEFDIWASGLLGYQNGYRKELKIFEKNLNIIKFHPIIDLSRIEIAQYVQIYELPIHPLVFKGYDSIGCRHCTKKGNGRTGRWINSAKTECGLHV